jgi:hypothetical protein
MEMGHPPAPGPHPKGLRNLTGRTVAPSKAVIPRAPRRSPRGASTERPSISPPPGGRVPVLASHPDMRSPVDPPGRMSSRRSHAGSPQGFLTRRNLISSRVWLTNAIDRIVKESHPTPVLRSSSWLGSKTGIGLLAPLVITRRHRPESGAFQQLTPAVFSHRFHSRGKSNITPEIARVNSPLRNFPEFRTIAPVLSPSAHHNSLGCNRFCRCFFAWSRPPGKADEISQRAPSSDIRHGGPNSAGIRNQSICPAQTCPPRPPTSIVLPVIEPGGPPAHDAPPGKVSLT